MKRWLSTKRMMILCQALLVSLMLAVPAVHAENGETGQISETGNIVSSEAGITGNSESGNTSDTGSSESGSTGDTGSSESGSTGDIGNSESSSSGDTDSSDTGNTGSSETGNTETDNTGSSETGNTETGNTSSSETDNTETGNTGSSETGNTETEGTGSSETGNTETEGTGSSESDNTEKSGETGAPAMVPASMICRHIGSEGSLWGEWTIKNKDEHTRTCSFCKATETRPHNWSEWVKGEGNVYKRICVDCGKKEEHKDHVPGKAVRENLHYETCTRDGWYDSVVYCKICGGELSRKKKYTPPHGHSYMVTGRTIIRLYYECRYCGEEDWTYNEHSQNLMPGLVRDEWDRNYGYTSDIVETRGQRVLILTPHKPVSENASSAYSVFLKPSDVRNWTNDSVDAVILRFGETDLKIRLYNISPDWFPADTRSKRIDYYVFTLGLEDGGAKVTVATQIGEGKIPAESFSGVTLMRKPEDMEITENGVY